MAGALSENGEPRQRRRAVAPLAAAAAAATPERRAALRRRQELAAQVAVAMPELGWAACEALFMPLLLTLRVPNKLLGVSWLCSPVFGFVLQPVVGNLSDRHGRRPFIVAFGLAATLGLLLMPPCTRLPREMGIPAALVAFGLADVSHDVLLTPSRAAMNDVFEAELSEQRCGVAAGLGKLVALLLVSLLSEEAAFAAVAAVMAFAVGAQLMAPNLPVEVCEEEKKSVGTVAAPRGFRMVWVLQAAGWLSICAFNFFFTSVWSQRAGNVPGTSAFTAEVRLASAMLFGQALVFTALGFVLPRIVRLLGGELAALVSCLLAYAAVLLSFAAGPPALVAVGTVLVVPFAEQVLVNAPFAWLETQPGFDASARGRLTGCLSASLAVAQGIVAIGSGPLVEVADGRLVSVFVAVAVLDICTVVGVALSWGCGCLAARSARGLAPSAAVARTALAPT